MNQRAKQVPYFWVDDVYFTGILLENMTEIQRYDFEENDLFWSFYTLDEYLDGKNYMQIQIIANF